MKLAKPEKRIEATKADLKRAPGKELTEADLRTVAGGRRKKPRKK